MKLKKRFAKLSSFARKNWRLVATISVVAAVSIYVAITWSQIDRWSIWFDESFGAFLVRFNLFDIARYTAFDVHPPLYYWLLKGWTEVFGSTDVALRSLSIVFGAGTIIMGFLLTKKMFGRRASLIVLPLLALSPMLIRYGFEARMYTLAALIVLAATYVLVLAEQKNSRKLWVWYGVLVAAGMWTHYFTALVFAAQWIWRYVKKRSDGHRGKALVKVFFDRNWLTAYLTAFILYLPWLPFLAKQLQTVQASGFWIPQIGTGTVTNYVTNMLTYEYYRSVGPWGTVLVFVIVGLAIWIGVRAYRIFRGARKNSLVKLSIMAFAPVVLLVIVSLPPLRSSFVDRYLLPSIVLTMVWLGVVIAVKTTGWTNKLRPLLFGLLIGAFAIGIGNVVHYGNYNRFTHETSRIKQTMQQIQAESTDHQIVIAETPWVFYDAIVYDSSQNPVYFLDSSTDYYYGSLRMLEENDFRKIINLDEFVRPGQVVWFIGSSDVTKNPPADNWKLLGDFTIKDPTNDEPRNTAAQFLVE